MVRRATVAAALLLSSSSFALLNPAARKVSSFPVSRAGIFRQDRTNVNKFFWPHQTGELRKQRTHDCRVRQHHSPMICSMYLPPGGPNKSNNGLGPVLQSVLTFLLVVGFFLSPLGGFVFAMIQFSLALSIIVPLALIASFQVWQYFNTVSGPCPSCGAPLRVFKDQASICLNCGSIVEADASQSKINLVSNIITDDDKWQGGGGDFGWMDGYFGARPTPPSRTQSDSSIRRERTIIDIQVLDDDE